MAARVSALSIAPVKATRLRRVEAIDLQRTGAVGDRAFYLIDERGRVVNGKRSSALQAVVADLDTAASTLALTLPDGSEVAAEVALGATVETQFFSTQRPARLVDGPFSAALSEVADLPLRLVAPEESAVDRGAEAAASLVSRASVARLATEAGEDTVDARRFRMLIEIDGVDAHAEDGWMGRPVAVGGARVRVGGNIGRCMVTTFDPDSGRVTLPTLELLGQYRREVPSTEPLPFGVYAEVLEPGPVRVGDSVTPE